MVIEAVGKRKGLSLSRDHLVRKTKQNNTTNYFLKIPHNYSRNISKICRNKSNWLISNPAKISHSLSNLKKLKPEIT